MKKILIIRSVSFQQLDLNLPAIKEKYGSCTISLLTHEHGLKLAEKYSDIKKNYVYPYKDGFKITNKVEELANIEFDIVVVPVTNINGGGFFNVLKFSTTMNAKERVLCNVISEINRFTMRDVYLLEIKSFFMKNVSIFITIIMAPLVLILLLFKLSSIEKK